MLEGQRRGGGWANAAPARDGRREGGYLISMSKLPLFGKAHEAAPGADFTWFVYGSSLDRDALGAWAEEHGYRAPTFAGARRVRLEGFRLAFDVASDAIAPPTSVENPTPRLFAQ